MDLVLNIFLLGFISKMKFILCLFAITHIVVGKTLPNEETCTRSDPNLNTCLLNNAEKVIRKLSNGIPEYEMEPLDPILLDFMTVETHLDNFRLKMAMTNMSTYGLRNAKVQKIKFDPETLTGDLSITVPYLIYTCDYLATGKLFQIPLESNAYHYGNYSDVSISYNFRLKNVKRKGVEYFSVEKLTLKFDVNGKFYMKLESIDPSRQPQVQLIQDFMNENNELIKETVRPATDEYIGYYYKYVFERYLRKIPAADLLPLK